MNEEAIRSQYGTPDSATLVDKAAEIAGKPTLNELGLGNIAFRDGARTRRACKLAGNPIFYVDDADGKFIDNTWDGDTIRSASTKHKISAEPGGLVRYELAVDSSTLNFGQDFDADGAFTFVCLIRP